ncbi:hypothetical protein Q4E40_07025 [Pontibacter sp. BT731]|uniref:hypothetical protein n=1 Tax=Pontibacter coccineus TaxID=3063328 RepID=UPI0026E162E7|nr:hypothetical protein [Pontibacter sp. BT731]MDO6389874.1 hypothetical protein [Pontibacter sp. BT731]
MKTTAMITIARILLGAIFTFAGLNGFLFLLGIDPIGATSLHLPFMQVLVSTPFVFIPLKTLELVAGVMLLVNRYVLLALLILLPIGVNVLLFHLFADPSLLINGIVVVLLLGLLLFHYRKHYAGLLTSKL